MKGNESSTSLVHLARNSKSHEESIQKSRVCSGTKLSTNIHLFCKTTLVCGTYCKYNLVKKSTRSMPTKNTESQIIGT